MGTWVPQHQSYQDGHRVVFALSGLGSRNINHIKADWITSGRQRIYSAAPIAGTYTIAISRIMLKLHQPVLCIALVGAVSGVKVVSGKESGNSDILPYV